MGFIHSIQDCSSAPDSSINENDIIIAVMGPTGVGKSSFINIATKRLEAAVGNDAKPVTRGVQPVRCQHPDGRRNIVLLDTPGFDETRLSAFWIRRIIAKWLKDTYQNNNKLAGLLYLCPTYSRMAGTLHLRNLAVFRDLCGADNLKNIVLVTTMRGRDQDERIGGMREEELLSHFWKDMISLGARACHFQGTYESAWEVIDRLDLYHSFIDENDIVIAIMGLTGAGKSSFINKAAGRMDVVIGHGLESQTRAVKPVRCLHPDGRRNIVLVDTPGFDDTFLSDSQVLKIIANWLKETYQKNIQLSGLLYLHRISDNRMAGTPLRNLAVFKDLCGADNLKNVILVTTMWDRLEEQSVGFHREKELQSDFWKDMISFGSRTCRFQGTYESAWEIIDALALGGSRLAPLQIQGEIVATRLPLQKPTAASTLLHFLAGEFKKVWARLRSGAR